MQNLPSHKLFFGLLCEIKMKICVHICENILVSLIVIVKARCDMQEVPYSYNLTCKDYFLFRLFYSNPIFLVLVFQTL